MYEWTFKQPIGSSDYVGKGINMHFLGERYSAVMKHKGIAICALKVAIPLEGDELGYVIDHKFFKNNVYENLQDAMAAVDKKQG